VDIHAACHCGDRDGRSQPTSMKFCDIKKNLIVEVEEKVVKDGSKKQKKQVRTGWGR
jgi:hypothetical protein